MDHITAYVNGYAIVGMCTAAYFYAVVYAMSVRPDACATCRRHVRRHRPPMAAMATMAAVTAVWPLVLPWAVTVTLHRCDRKVSA